VLFFFLDRVCHNTHLAPLASSLYMPEALLAPIKVLHFTVISARKICTVTVFGKCFFENYFTISYINHTSGLKFNLLYTVHCGVFLLN
jgi:hypothetical protein